MACNTITWGHVTSDELSKNASVECVAANIHHNVKLINVMANVMIY